MTEFSPLEDRLPPQNIEAEEAILGGILMDSEALTRVAELLRPEAFYVAAHQDIYRAALLLNAQGLPTDLMSVTTYLEDNALLEKVGGKSALRRLVEFLVNTVNIDQYARLIADKYTRRQLIRGGQEVVALGYDTAQDITLTLDQAEQKIFAVTQERVTRSVVPASDILLDIFESLEQRFTEGAEIPGIPSSFYDLDSLTQGFQPSDLIIVAGRPSMGKTSLCLSIGHNITQKANLPVVVFSLEMSKEQLVQRLLSSEAEIDSHRLRSGRISENEWQKVGTAIGRLASSPLFIDDTPNATVMEMRSKCRRLMAEQGGRLGMIIIDYLQLMEGSSDNRVQELSKITRGLKGLGRELKVPVMALSQLSRAVEARTNKRPMLSDLRESGCLTGDSLITLADSGIQVPIRNLVGKSGFAVWGLDETSLKLNRATVSNAFSTGQKPVFRLKTRLGRTIRATGNHKFLTIRGWQRLDELQTGDRLALPRQLGGPTLQTMSDPELALLGHLIGDGCTLPRHAIQYTTRELDLAHMVANLAKEAFGDLLSPRIQLERNWYQVYLSSSQRLTHNVRNPIAKWLDSLDIFGLRSHEKFIPRLIFEQPEEAIALFLKHLWSTDGCIKLVGGKCTRPIAYYASSSEQLANNVQSLLLRLGINARLSVISQAGKGQNQHHVTITGKSDLQIFIEKVGAVGNYKSQSLQEIADYIESRTINTNRDVIPQDIWELYALPSMQRIGMSQRKMQAGLEMAYCGTSLHKQNVSRDRAARIAQVVQSDDLLLLSASDIYWDEIVAIEPDGVEEVFDLTVPGLHNFIANNIVVHNSIEQDADLVMMVYRDEYYNADSPDRGIAEVILSKHRNGPTGTVKLLFEKQFARFKNLA